MRYVSMKNMVAMKECARDEVFCGRCRVFFCGCEMRMHAGASLWSTIVDIGLQKRESGAAFGRCFFVREQSTRSGNNIRHVVAAMPLLILGCASAAKCGNRLWCLNLWPVPSSADPSRQRIPLRLSPLASPHRIGPGGGG